MRNQISQKQISPSWTLQNRYSVQKTTTIFQSNSKNIWIWTIFRGNKSLNGDKLPSSTQTSTTTSTWVDLTLILYLSTHSSPSFNLNSNSNLAWAWPISAHACFEVRFQAKHFPRILFLWNFISKMFTDNILWLEYGVCMSSQIVCVTWYHHFGYQYIHNEPYT